MVLALETVQDLKMMTSIAEDPDLDMALLNLMVIFFKKLKILLDQTVLFSDGTEPRKHNDDIDIIQTVDHQTPTVHHVSSSSDLRSTLSLLAILAILSLISSRF